MSLFLNQNFIRKCSIFFVILISVLILISCNHSQKQEKANLTYLYQLNRNLLSTIDMLTAFNKIANNMGPEISGSDFFSQFLLESTIQVSEIIQLIRNAENREPEEIDNSIRDMMSILQPHEIQLPAKISKNQNEENLDYLKTLNQNLDFQIPTLLKELTKEEKIIAEIKKITPNYIRLHSHFFLFSVLKDFSEPQVYLSTMNRHYLVELSKAIDVSLDPERKNGNKTDQDTQPTGPDSL